MEKRKNNKRALRITSGILALATPFVICSCSKKVDGVVIKDAPKTSVSDYTDNVGDFYEALNKEGILEDFEMLNDAVDVYQKIYNLGLDDTIIEELEEDNEIDNFDNFDEDYNKYVELYEKVKDKKGNVITEDDVQLYLQRRKLDKYASLAKLYIMNGRQDIIVPTLELFIKQGLKQTGYEMSSNIIYDDSNCYVYSNGILIKLNDTLKSTAMLLDRNKNGIFPNLDTKEGYYNMSTVIKNAINFIHISSGNKCDAKENKIKSLS